MHRRNTSDRCLIERGTSRYIRKAVVDAQYSTTNHVIAHTDQVALLPGILNMHDKVGSTIKSPILLQGSEQAHCQPLVVVFKQVPPGPHASLGPVAEQLDAILFYHVRHPVHAIAILAKHV
jgi:hypothetical protein